MTTKNKNYYVSLLLDLLKTLLISFVIYFAVATLLAAILEEEKNAVVIQTVVSAVFYVIYYFSFYLMHARKDAEDYALNMPDGEYSFQSDITEIIKSEGSSRRRGCVFGIGFSCAQQNNVRAVLSAARIYPRAWKNGHDIS